MTKPGFIDIGLNLTHDSFDVDREEVVQRAIDAGVSQMILTGASEEGSRAALDLARKYPGRMYSTSGVHPHHAKECGEGTIAILREVAAAKEVVAIGECGLDFFRNFSSPAIQEEWFEKQLELAIETALPLFLHERDAYPRFGEILKNYAGRIKGAVVHCFTGSQEALRAYLDLGCLIGITGWICDERRGLALRELVRLIPLDRLMVETDAPYLLPRDLKPRPRSQRNEPCYLPHVTRVVASCMGRDLDEVAQATTENAQRFFGISERE